MRFKNIIYDINPEIKINILMVSNLSCDNIFIEDDITIRKNLSYDINEYDYFNDDTNRTKQAIYDFP